MMQEHRSIPHTVSSYPTSFSPPLYRQCLMSIARSSLHIQQTFCQITYISFFYDQRNLAAENTNDGSTHTQTIVLKVLVDSNHLSFFDLFVRKSLNVSFISLVQLSRKTQITVLHQNFSLFSRRHLIRTKQQSILSNVQKEKQMEGKSVKDA
jgi:hypothetical protein